MRAQQPWLAPTQRRISCACPPRPLATKLGSAISACANPTRSDWRGDDVRRLGEAVHRAPHQHRDAVRLQHDARGSLRPAACSGCRPAARGDGRRGSRCERRRSRTRPGRPAAATAHRPSSVVPASPRYSSRLRSFMPMAKPGRYSRRARRTGFAARCARACVAALVVVAPVPPRREKLASR